MAHSGHEYSDRDIEDTLEEMGLVLPDRSYFDDLRKGKFNQTFHFQTNRVTSLGFRCK